MQCTLDLIYEGQGFSGSFDLVPWLPDAESDDVVALMDMVTGMNFADAPSGLRRAYAELAGEARADEPTFILFRDQAALLERLKTDHPTMWESASGSALRCETTPDMFGDLT